MANSEIDMQYQYYYLFTKLYSYQYIIILNKNINYANRTALYNQPSATAAMTDDTPLPFDLLAVCRKNLTVDFDAPAGTRTRSTSTVCDTIL